jgi:hypothetical protein
MTAGTYYVGDLCYVMHDCWDEVCELLGDCNEGEFQLKDGRRFSIYNTQWGDGNFESNGFFSFSVDSGTLGCILKDDIADPSADITGGSTIDFDEEFEVSSNGSTIFFGDKVSIYTGYDEVEEDDDYIDDYEDEE